MYILRTEHPVPDYDGWKKAFDSDPVGREKLGVRRHACGVETSRGHDHDGPSGEDC
jgi:hypothetical protein